jgi:hypothetical protein
MFGFRLDVFQEGGDAITKTIAVMDRTRSNAITEIVRISSSDVTTVNA